MLDTVDLSNKTKSMKNVLQDKLASMLEAGKIKSKQHIDRINFEGKLLNDYVVDLNNKAIKFDKYDTEIVLLSSEQNFGLHEHAVEQFCQKLGLPVPFIRDHATSKIDWEIDLAVYNLNKMVEHSTRERVLLREIDNQIRGVLSDQYKRLNSPVIYDSFFESARQRGLMVCSAHAGDIKSFVEVVFPELIAVDTEKNGTVYVAFGMRIRTSDFGASALDVSMFMLMGVCLNGMTLETKFREVHKGSIIPHDIEISRDTYLSDTKTTALQIRDTVNTYFKRPYLEEIAAKIQGASNKIIEVDNELKKLPKLGLTKEEIESVKSVITNNRVDDGMYGENTMWKLTQAVSAVGRDSDNEIRKRELEELSGSLLLRVN